MVTDFSTTMLNLFQHYQNKLLPFSGGIYDQPNAYQQAIGIIDAYIAEEHQRILKNQR